MCFRPDLVEIETGVRRILDDLRKWLAPENIEVVFGGFGVHRLGAFADRGTRDREQRCSPSSCSRRRYGRCRWCASISRILSTTVARSARTNFGLEVVFSASTAEFFSGVGNVTSKRHDLRAARTQLVDHLRVGVTRDRPCSHFLQCLFVDADDHDRGHPPGRLPRIRKRASSVRCSMLFRNENSARVLPPDADEGIHRQPSQRDHRRKRDVHPLRAAAGRAGRPVTGVSLELP